MHSPPFVAERSGKDQMRKYFILLIAAGILSGCSDREKSSASSKKEKVPVSDIKGETTIPETSESAALKDSEYKFKVEYDGIVYYDGGSVLQKIELDCTDLIKRAESYDRDPEEFLIISDFNFDGYDDLFVPDIIGTPNIPGTYFYMNPTRNFNSFEKWDVLNEVGFLMKADSENGVLHFSSRGSAVDHDWIIYKWGSGKLQPVSRELQYMNGSEIYIDCFKYDDDGKEILVGRKRAVLGENNEWLGTEEVELLNLYTYSVNEYSVDVLLDGKIVQTLECDYPPDNRLFFEDYDFDGYNDLFVMMKNGAMFSNGTYFHYVAETGFFEKWDELNKIGRKMIVNAENSTLREKNYNDDYWLEYYDYKWEYNKLVLYEHRVSETGENMEIYSVDSAGNEKLIGTEVK